MDEPKAVYVLDCGGQYCHLIASRIRQHAALSKVVPCDVDVSTLANAGAVIVSGGPESVFDPEARRVDPRVWNLDVPILGICYGCQMLCHDLGGRVEEGSVGEFGEATLRVLENGQEPVLGLKEAVVWMSHRDRIVELPPGFKTVGTTDHSPHACVAHSTKPVFGLQWHPEVKHSTIGFETLGAFVDLAGLRGTWKCENFVDAEIKRLQEIEKSVFVLVSGGVDSTVAYALIAKALPADRVAGLYVDTGMMRKGETKLVKESLKMAGLSDNIKYVDASESFLKALEGIVEPELKRRAIGNEFLQVQRRECAKLEKREWLLGQGTIYPDTIESGGDQKGKKADVIKTHHNRVPEIDALLAAGLVVEPLAKLYKDEVRKVGEQLGLPPSLVWRHPFPGPGLGVRLLCTNGEYHPEIPSPIPNATVPPIRSVGCQGDSRTYRNFLVLDSYDRDWDKLSTHATSLINANTAINRVVISLVDKAKGDFVVTPSAPHTVTRDRLDKLRDADDAVTRILYETGYMDKIWQCPVAMAPIVRKADEAVGREAIILRPVDSTEAMTASFSKLPWNLVDQLASAVQETLGDACSDVLYDITNKPPGTIEWE